MCLEIFGNKVSKIIYKKNILMFVCRGSNRVGSARKLARTCRVMARAWPRLDQPGLGGPARARPKPGACPSLEKKARAQAGSRPGAQRL